MELFEQLGLDMGYILLGVAVICILLLILTLVQTVRLNKLTKKYKAFMGKDTDGSLERRILDRLSRIGDVEEQLNHVQGDIKIMEKALRSSYQKFSIVKYDAFHEAKGNISFVLCLLDHNNSGIILNSMYANDGCYSYIKELRFGNCELPLSEEEEQALQEAIAKGKILKEKDLFQ